MPLAVTRVMKASLVGNFLLFAVLVWLRIFPSEEVCERVSCLSSCLNDGRCVRGRCVCPLGYGGEDCRSVLVLVLVIVTGRMDGQREGEK